MIADANQRWREGRHSYRPKGEPIKTSEYDIAPIGFAEAKAFVTRHHYSRSFPASRFRFGLFHRGELVGAAVFSVPCRDIVLTSVFPGEATASVELGRLVLLDAVPGNGESHFVARCYELLRREGLVGVVSFSDPVSRTTSDGETIFAGHYGCVYQALNACYLGRGKGRLLRLLPDGSVLSDRAISKIRSREKGWEYASRLLESHGAQPLGPSDDERAWLRTWIPRLTRPLRHGGNHKYAWALDRRARRFLPPSLPYVKTVGA